jgi:hypothetical protein
MAVSFEGVRVDAEVRSRNGWIFCGQYSGIKCRKHIRDEELLTQVSVRLVREDERAEPWRVWSSMARCCAAADVWTASRSNFFRRKPPVGLDARTGDIHLSIKDRRNSRGE